MAGKKDSKRRVIGVSLLPAEVEAAFDEYLAEQRAIGDPNLGESNLARMLIVSALREAGKLKPKLGTKK